MTQSFSDILYYSIVFSPTEHQLVLKLIDNTVFKNTVSTTKGLFVKTETSFIPCFTVDLSTTDKATLVMQHQKAFSQLKTNEVFIINDGVLYKLNDEFHITTLFTGGKKHEKSEEMEAHLGKELQISLQKIAVSNDFITIGLGDFTSPYYGNDFKHMTIGLAKSDKKIFPKDSPNAFSNGKVYDVNVTITGLTSKFVKIAPVARATEVVQSS
jgi:hypothetical protein